MSIVIKELFGSDSISDLVRKINENFDQLLINGGGPEGPVGPVGQQGVAGPEGIRGSQWFGVTSVGGTGATGETTINQPTDGVFRDNDFSLDGDGNVDYYDNGIWLPTDINLKGSKGDKGIEGDGTISVIKGVENFTDPVAGQVRYQPSPNQLAEYLDRIEDIYIADPNNSDDDDFNGGSFVPNKIIGGLDFITLGRGNNSLVLGRYASLFYNAQTQIAGASAYYKPPTSNVGNANATIKSFPDKVADVPMLILAQNDYKGDKDEINANFTNGISIGLMKSHPSIQYNSTDPYQSIDGFDYNKFANISIENRFSDLKIEAWSKLTLTNKDSFTKFRLGTSSQGRSDTTDVHDISTLLYSPVYTEFNIEDSIIIDNSNFGSDFDTDFPNTYHGVINRTHFNLDENKSLFGYNGFLDSRKFIGRSFITLDSSTPVTTPGSTSELILMTNTGLQDSSGINERKNRKQLNFQEGTFILDSNSANNPLALGQTVVNVKKHLGDTIDPSNPDVNIHLGYLGLGYDQSFIQYSGIDDYDFSGSNSINDGNVNVTLDGVLPNDVELENFLGYDIKDPINQQTKSRSVSRIGLYPGIFRIENLPNGDPDEDDNPVYKRREKFFDISHKMLPTGSMDLFGTVRLREQETTNDGAKDGYVAVNKKDGIVGWERPNFVPTYSIQMFSELASDKFSFYTISSKELGASGISAVDFILGGTSLTAAFIGKGSKELQDYYICNGAVLADERDILVSGPYSKMEGMNLKPGGDAGATYVSDGVVTLDDSNFVWSLNENFIGTNGFTAGQILDNDSNLLYETITSTANSFIKTSAVIYGYSILAPDTCDSGFRIVLPNYFGRVPKMVFPDSDYILKGIYGQDFLPENVGLISQDIDAGFKLYSSNFKYNTTWMMRGSFETLGFPYLKPQHLPAHTHELYIDNSTNIETSTYSTNLVTNTSANRGYSNGFNFMPNERITWKDEYGEDRATSVFFGDFDDTKSFYEPNSNWINNEVDINGKPARGQIFIEPPYKGTYMAINLRGVLNPLRNNTEILNFHHISGIPISGGFDSLNGDMSWYSTTNNASNYIYTAFPVIGDVHDVTINDYEYGFRKIARNDSHSHPYTYYDTNAHDYETPLEYNSSDLTTNEKFENDLYKSSAEKDDFDRKL